MACSSKKPKALCLNSHRVTTNRQKSNSPNMYSNPVPGACGSVLSTLHHVVFNINICPSLLCKAATCLKNKYSLVHEDLDNDNFHNFASIQRI